MDFRVKLLIHGQMLEISDAVINIPFITKPGNQ